jgi:putative cardiolipin synthase
MLQAGVNLYEFKATHDTPSARLENEEKSHGDSILGSQSRSSLHAKVYEIDRQLLIIGSMNLDPRSRNLNTELLVVIHSPELATQASEIFAGALNPTQSYHVTLAPETAGVNPLSSTSLVWTSQEDGKLVEYHHEPGAELWRRLVEGIFFVLPVEGEL